MTAKTILVLIFLVITVFTLTAIAHNTATQNKGAEEISIFGGSRGNILFPHLLHQNTIGDCMVCHDIFPKERESIKNLKVRGELKKKQVMNKTCINCHKAMKLERKETGPTSCKKCHMK